MGAMNGDRKLDYKIRATLHKNADSLHVSAASEQRLFAEIAKLEYAKKCECIQKERYAMKKFSGKLLVAVCAIFCLTCMTALAANGIINGWVSHNMTNTETENYSELADKAIAKLDFDPLLVESFSNGYEFQRGGLSVTNGLDENHQKMSQNYYELDVWYVNKASGDRVVLTANQLPETQSAEDLSGRPAAVTTTYGDVTLTYQLDHYKFVPPNYELTDEDIAAEADGSLFISYGSDEVELMDFASVSWTLDGINYTLSGFDTVLDSEEMVGMAEEVISAGVQ
jgi:uncharacterized membrane protein (Fun14 family)